MLDMQTAVFDATRDLHKLIEGSEGKKLRPNDIQISARRLAKKQKANIAEMKKTIDMLKANGTATALSEVRADMILVQTRLKNCDFGLATQEIENDIIESFREMINALKPWPPRAEDRRCGESAS
jgi:hypothetical protein